MIHLQLFTPVTKLITTLYVCIKQGQWWWWKIVMDSTKSPYWPRMYVTRVTVPKIWQWRCIVTVLGYYRNGTGTGWRFRFGISRGWDCGFEFGWWVGYELSIARYCSIIPSLKRLPNGEEKWKGKEERKDLWRWKWSYAIIAVLLLA